MKTLIKSIVFFLIAITVIFFGGAYILPGEVRVERSVEITAPPEKVFAIAGNLRRAPEWLPWAELDPATAFTFDGPEQGGVGQVMHWASNNPLVGSGRETVTDYTPNERIALSLDYGDFGKAASTMLFAPSGNGTAVRWSFSAKLPGVIDRWAGLMVDRQAGAEYEKALANLKRLVEVAPAAN